MDSSIFRLSLDIQRQTTQAHLAVRKGDTARKIVAALSDGGRPYRIDEGCYAVFKGKKPDGNVLYNDCTIINNCIVYEFTEQTAASAGYMDCELQLYGAEGQIITSPKIAVIVSGLVYDDSEVESSGEFTALAKALTDVAEMKANGLKGDEGDSAYEVAVSLGFEGSEADWLESLRGPEGPVGPAALHITVSYDGEKYVADKAYAEILEAAGKQQPMYVLMEPYMLGVEAVSQGSALFQMHNGAEYRRVVIREDGTVSISDGMFATKEDLTGYALLEDLEGKMDVPAASGDYFGITDDGMIYLLPAYRGAIFQYEDEYRELYKYSESDNGVGFVGTKHAELPEEIIIPEIVNEIPVTSYARAMFLKNLRVKRLTLLDSVKTIPAEFCSDCYNLEDVSGTEKVETVGSMAFAYSGITKAIFPGLKQFDGTYQFYSCPMLLVADLGEITTIPDGCFGVCERLTAIRNGEKVTSVGVMGLYFTKRLLTPSFVGSLKSIGDFGLLLSRTDYNWDSLTDCEFGAKSTAKYLNATDFWSGCNATPCNTPMRSTFDQHDPRWVDKEIGNTGRKWASGCLYVAAAMAHSALTGVDMESPEEFVEIVRAANPALMDEPIDDIADDVDYYAGLEAWLEAVGLQVECPGVYTAESLQTMYNALANGSLVISRCLGDGNGSNHAVVIHGINARGELLITDPAAPASNLLGIYEAHEYAMPVQNIVRGASDFFAIVTR